MGSSQLVGASSPNEPRSPDSGIRLVASGGARRNGIVTTLELRFPGGVKIAQRVEVPAPPAALQWSGHAGAPRHELMSMMN